MRPAYLKELFFQKLLAIHLGVLRLRRALGRLRLYAVAQERAAASDLFEQRSVFDERDACGSLPRARHQVVGDDDRVRSDVRHRAVVSGDDRLHHFVVGKNRHILAVALDVLVARGDEQLLDLPHRKRFERVLRADDGESTRAVLVQKFLDLFNVRLRVVAVHGFERLFEDFVFGRVDVEAEHVHDTLGDRFRELLFEKGNDHLVAREDDVLDVVLAHDLLQLVGDLFGVLQMVVLQVALVAHLRPAADLRAARLDVLHLVALQGLAATEDEQARAVRVGDEHGVARVLIHQARERVEVRLVVNVEAVILDRRGELDGLEEIIRARAGEDRRAVRLWPKLFRQVFVDALGVAVEALARGAVRRVGARALRELFAQEALEVLPPAVVRLRVQVKTYDRQSDRLELREAVYNLLQSAALGCAALYHLVSPLSSTRKFTQT